MSAIRGGGERAAQRRRRWIFPVAYPARDVLSQQGQRSDLPGKTLETQLRATIEQKLPHTALNIELFLRLW